MKTTNIKTGLRYIFTFLIGPLLIFLVSHGSVYGQIIFNEDFEGGIGSWFSDNGLWDVGIATVGPTEAHSGQQVAGTVLDGNYPHNSNTRFISPQIQLDSLSSNKQLLLKFWYWHKNHTDYGQVQLSVDGGAWISISSALISQYSAVWSQYVADLSAYAGSAVRIAYYFTSNNQINGEGWYIDDVSVEIGEYNLSNPEDFESGVGHWSADNGLWQVGVPMVGPDSAYSGQQVAGTVLAGDYPINTKTRLISPRVTLTPLPGEQAVLFFRHWYRFASGDFGLVQVSVNGGSWETVSSTFDGDSPTWTQSAIDLSDYQDSIIQLAFYFNSNNQITNNGWYIDACRIEGVMVSSVEEKAEDRNPAFTLFQNQPNPFKNATTIPFNLSTASFVELTVYDITGQKIATLINQQLSAGEYQVPWSALTENNSRISAGIFWYCLKAGPYCKTKKMVLY